jgi:peptidoglycan/LPS O-acetylase OafA/YrhL
MTATLAEETAPRIGVVRHAISGVWGAVSGIAPHVLHHVGPLAGAAIFAGAAGRVLFFFLGLAVATPMLIRVYRRFRTWLAPAIAVGLFAVAYALSSAFIGPLISDSEAVTNELPSVSTTIDPHGH